jgi:predicted phosphodiesterase
MRTPVYLQNPSEDAMTVMWITNVPCRSWVEYGIDSLNMKSVASWDEGIMVANNLINKIVLEGLTPGTKYYYRACSQEIKRYGPYDKEFGETERTPVREFTTWSDDMTDFTVLVFNDLHKKTELFTRLMQVVGETEYDLVIFNGDYIDDPDTESDIVDTLSKFCSDYGSDTVPSIFIRGNHEIRGAYSLVLWNYISKVSEQSYAAFNLGDTRFVLLDCGEDKPDDHAEYSGMNDFTGYREAQAGFLAAEIPSQAFAKASRRILIHHIPLYVKAVEKFNPCKELWQPYLVDAGFDVALNGHTHRHEYVAKGTSDNNFPVVVGGSSSDTGATVTILRKTGNELNLKVVQIDGTTLLNLNL